MFRLENTNQKSTLVATVKLNKQLRNNIEWK